MGGGGAARFLMNYAEGAGLKPQALDNLTRASIQCFKAALCHLEPAELIHLLGCWEVNRQAKK